MSKESEILERLKKNRDKKTLKQEYKDVERFSKLRTAIKNIKRKNSGK